MAKGWTVVSTINDAVTKTTKEDKKRYNKRYNKYLTRPTLSEEDLKNEGERLFEKKVEKEDNLIFAYNNKLLKSKTAIKEARIAIKQRAAKKNKNKTAENA